LWPASTARYKAVTPPEQGTHAADAHYDVCAMALQKLQLAEIDQRRELQVAQSVCKPLRKLQLWCSL